MKELYCKYSLIILIIGLGILLFRQAQPFMNGILGAVTLFLLLRTPTYSLQQKINSRLAVWIVTIGTAIFILIPLSLFNWAIISQFTNIHFDTQSIIQQTRQVTAIIKEYTGFDILSERTLAFAVSQASSIVHSVMNSVGDFIMNLCVAIMLLFFMLYEGRNMEAYISALLPFTEKNKRKVLKKIQVIVRSNAIGIPLLAVIQGTISLGGYLLAGVANPFLAAMLTAFTSVIPIVGTALIWLPIAICYMLAGDWMNALVLIGYGGLIVAQCDNFIRFILQKKMADTHPMITVFGVVAGIPVFGFMGVIFGPLIVSLFLLFVEMFRNEYLLDDNAAQ